ncbi:DDE superfamily endonuclease [Popillia japonica]|uniref:DDE superfamily endonuclease n=1 Tax=Popillia japonica TaxID=7064 RepID=A0AAW1JGN8_POPJA
MAEASIETRAKVVTLWEPKPRSGAPKKISPQDGNTVLDYVAQNPFAASTKVIEALHLNSNINRDWDSVIFTDEKVFSTSQDTRKLIWRPNNTRLDPRNVVTIRQSSRITLAYWGWMSSAGPGELTCIGTRLNAVEYIRILEDVLLPSVGIVYPPPHRITLVQDNSAVHTAAVVQEWFQQHQEDTEVLPWPAKSPELNPIENLWAAMGRMWELRDVPVPRNRHVTGIWEHFRGHETCANLLASMPRRLQEVIDTNGYWTHY